ncbi:biotin--[acetyl-CoA-carboxylase] ligase [Maridesulfovibrio hydrothermalis]|uniref:biotin--[biotin carboxyl-carrier protein] ligase n=1 Tax=Maridesulfovibrio hydrothermalis AM13 = DSM 14728 TaxID=1121451 RepID=L0RG00_9BACT|nr:biotin--[acetyl-CoA-carboxylase] ligase [Maridesulfovibrio hydrothermalis]CCO24476.1 Biotin/acetyl-CoA-carboxylase ligase [Maridesulfovibrio hydrothermalis AM13 = DSM 14728]
MITRITIINGKAESPLPEVTPEKLFQAHPLWARDIEHYGPWNSEDAEYKTYSTWLSGSRTGVPVAVCGACVSSLDVAWRLNALEDLPDWGSVIALEQNTGRGQVRREWISPAGNIYGAIKWPSLPAGDPGESRPVWNRILPLIVGYLTCNALKDLGVETQLKWPNDILIDGKKAGGILIEERGDVTMVGIGLNIAYAPERDQLRVDHAVPAGKLNTDKMQLGPLETWVGLMKYYKTHFDAIVSSQDADNFLYELADQLVWFGEEVKIVDGPDGVTQGVICGLRSDGGLVVEKDGVKHNIYSGSVMPL